MSSAPPATSCENLSDLGVRRRRTLGFVAAAGAVVWAIGLAGVGAPAGAFLTVGLPAWAAAIGLLQAKERTCVRLAAEGVREGPDMRVEPMPEEELSAIRAKARRISRRAMMVGAVVGVLAAVIAAVLQHQA